MWTESLSCHPPWQFGIFPDRAPACFPKNRGRPLIAINPMRPQQPSWPGPPLPEGWITRQQAAARLGIGLRTLDRWRSLAWGPPAARVRERGNTGHLICLYRVTDITTFRNLMLPRPRFARVLLEAPDGRIVGRASRWLKHTGRVAWPSAQAQA